MNFSIMPAGLTWSKYLKYTGSAFFAMVAGAQVVHMIYRPLDDLEKLIEEEKQRQREENSKNGVIRK
ncbi:LOW QUALITY PROTEIN: ubiquinol-cytochrome c reductase complex assembly factor 6 sloth 2 [Tachypleus tridentatus]|uniref:LOW QUALITY PROTEIN: ubiquinol-cytochrome c reductase complex assembly factor 6 sloth 2 n=1 Tax=Tachypleus tridentatus TaxID=6853 RepID=UPI003FD6AFF0